ELEKGDSKVAYNIDSLKLKDNNIAVIRFMEISGRSQASFMEGKTLYIAKEDFSGHTETSNEEVKGLYGYQIFDYQDKKYLGKVVGIKKIKKRNLERELMIIESETHQFPVPYEDEVIKSVDHKNKSIYVKMPFEFLEVL